MKIKNDAYLKLIIGTFVGLFIILSAIVMKGQEAKIEKLEDKLYLKQQNEEQATDFYTSQLNLKTIRTEFNELKDYTILHGQVSQDHTYEYSADSILGMKKEVTIKGYGNIQYDIKVSLKDAIITANEKSILVQIRRPELDISSVALQRDSLVIKDIDANFISNKYDGAQAQKFYIDSFVDAGLDNVKDLYKTESERKYINKVAESEVQALIQTLNLHNVTVRVKIIE